MRHRRLRSRQPPEPEQCEPLVEGEPAGWSGRIEPEISTQSLDLCSREFGSQTPPDRVTVPTEATPDEAPVVHGLAPVHKRSGATGEPKRDGVDSGRGIEVGTAKAPHDLDLPPRLEQQRGQGLPGTGTASKPFGRLTLDHEIGSGSRRRRKSELTIVTRLSLRKRLRSASDSALLNSTAMISRHRRASSRVRIPRPGPISTTRSFSCDGCLSDQASRKRPAPQEVL